MGPIIALSIAAVILAAVAAWLYGRLSSLRAAQAILQHKADSVQGELQAVQVARADLQRQLEEVVAKLRETQARYAAVGDVEQELQGRRADLQATKDDIARAQMEDQQRRDEFNARYAEAKAVYDRLKTEVSLLEENLEDITYGLYKPHYTFDTSEQYRQELDVVRDKKKAMIRDGTAATCPVAWAIGGNKREGERMTKQQMRVMLRAFNGECDASLAKVAWNNMTKMEHRVNQAFGSINEMGSVNQISISPEYLELSLAELRLAYEYAEKKHDEQEEQRQIREQMREEERAQREFERAQQEAAAEEVRYQKALDKARAEMQKASGAALDELSTKVNELEQKLAEARAQKERAISMAQLTKSGHVYVISNVGSFGEDVYKIGMTRRLEPTERVDELGGASVPFRFDVHAMIYAEDAPGLENAFHRQFSERRVNMVNLRKEFFRVSIQEIEQFAKEHHGVTVEFSKLAEARQFRETLAMIAKATPEPQVEAEEFPDALVVA